MAYCPDCGKDLEKINPDYPQQGLKMKMRCPNPKCGAEWEVEYNLVFYDGISKVKKIGYIN